MNRSAAWSSSAVVTPGRALRAQHLQAARLDRARRRHLLDLLGGLEDDPAAVHGLTSFFLHPQRREQRADPVADLVRRQRPSTRSRSPRPRSRRSAARSSRGTGSSRLRITSGLSSSRTIERRAADVADALVLGRVELDVEDVAVLDAGPPAAEPADDLLVGDVDQDRRGQPRARAPPSPRRAPRPAASVRGKPSRMKPSAASGSADALGDHADDHLVGHEVAAVHVLLRLARRARSRRAPRRGGCRRSRSRAAGSPPAGARPGCPCRTRAGRAG